MSHKYPYLSPYTYCAGNPVKFVDPNGEEIRITKEEDKDENITYQISYTATIVDKTNTLSEEQLEKVAKTITKQIESSFSGSTSDDEVSWNAKDNVNIKATGKPGKTDNIIPIKQLGKNKDGIIAGESHEGGRRQCIDIDLVKSDNTDQLGRVGAHEFGHGAFLPHHPDVKNVMDKYARGTIILRKQIEKIYSKRTFQGIEGW